MDGSSSAEPLLISGEGQAYFTKGKDNVSYMLLPSVLKKQPRLVVDNREAYGLTDVSLIENTDDLNPTRVSSITTIAMITDENGTEITMPITVSQQKRNALLTKELLRYVKVNGWSLDNHGNFVIDLKSWDVKQPLLKLPETEYNFSAHSAQVAAMIESKVTELTDRTSPESPAATLLELFDLVNSKLNVNIALLEVIVYASMIHGVDCYDLGRNTDRPVLGIANMTIKNRSIANVMGYKEQANTLLNPKSFFKLNRPDSLFDVLIRPREVIEYRKANGLNV